MGRTKNKKANIPPASQQEQPPVAGLSAPALDQVPPAATTPPVIETAVQSTDEVIPSLQPYLSLLPALRGIGASTQRALHEALYAAGSTAAQALESYLRDKSVVLKQLEGAENAEGTSESEELRLLLNYVSVELAADNLKRACMAADGKILLRDQSGKILNEVAAAALSAFAYAASRRPSTLAVEFLMKEDPTSSVDAPDDTGSQTSQTLSALADPKLCPQPHPGVVSSPHQMYGNGSNSFGVKPCRKRTPRRHVDDEDLLTDDEDEEELLDDNDLEDEVSDVELDEDSESLADLLDESRRSESPPDDFDNTDALLRFACTVGHVDIVKSLVQIRGSPEYHCIRKSTMLMEACCAGQTEVVRELLKAGADINAESDSRNTPLIYASTAGKLECVQELLKHKQIEVDARNTSGHTALMEASSAGHLDIVKELLDHGANIYAIVENVDFKESSLSLASYRGHVDVVKLLLDNMQECPEKVDELHTGLLEAAMDGHVEVARVLLDGGALVNLPTENFESPLTLAACGGHYELVKLLLDRNADIEEPNDESYTPLMEAAREGHRDVVELLLDRGANVNSKIEEGIETPLTLAASGGYLGVVELLVSRGGNLLLGERSPLYEATQEGHVEVADFVVKQLKKNEDPEAVLEDLNCALVCAAETNNMTLVNLYLENGANKDCFSKDGRTPLMEAARQGHVGMLEFLSQHGADINKISPNNDATALSLACLFGHSDATQFLLERGANPEVSLKDSVSCIIEASRNGNTDCARIVLDYIGMRTKQKHADLNPIATHPQQPIVPPTSTAAEISSRPKIKPVSKLNKDVNATVAPYPPVQAHHHQHLQLAPQGQPAPVFPSLNGAAVNLSLDKLISQQKQQQANEDSKLNELLQQLPGDLVNAMLAATATTNTVAGGNSMDESMLAHFLQRSLIEPKRRDAAWTNEELSAFKEMVRQKVRQLPAPSANASPATNAANQHDLIMANMLAGGECPGCAHNYPPYVNPPANENAPVSLKRKGPTVKPRTGSTISADSGSFGSRQINSVKQKVAEISEPIRSKLDAIQLSNDTDENLQELRKINAAQQQQHKAAQNSIQTSMYLNRMASNSATNTTTLTSEQQQQILFYQQQEIHNLQNLQTAAGHHHVGTATPHPTSGGCQGHHMNAGCLSQLHHGAAANRLARRTGQAVGAPKQLDRRGTGNSSLSVPPATPNEQSSYVDIQTDQNNDTALTVACVGGHSPLVSLLIQRGANVEHRDKKGFTPLILAATGGHIECCKLLLDANAQVDAVSERTKDTALSLACSSGRKEVVELLLRYHANKEHRNVSDYTPLSLAASGGYVDIIHLLLDAGAEINSRTGSKLGISPLMLAAMNGHDQATLLLLERGSDINAQIETNRNTALTLACFQGRTEVVRLLLEYNANYEHRAKTGLTPLMEAANGGFTDVGALLLKAGADPNAPPVPTSRDTALTIAADKGHSAFVSMLLLEGAAIDVKNKKGCTPLFLACSNGHLDTVKILVGNHADVDGLDNRKTSPLVAAFRKGFVKVVEFMADRVNQYPNDQECQRFCNTIIDPELAEKVQKCLTVIVNAKEKQAEQANKAAQSLLDQLAEEEALAESKKLSKKRLKEKKKAKKLAKKQLELEEEAAAVIEVTPEPEEPEPVAMVPPPAPIQPEPTTKRLKKKNAIKEQQASVPTPVQPVKEETPEPAPIVEENRVPIVHEVVQVTQENGSVSVQNAHDKKNQRRQNRGRRSEQVGNQARISIHTNTNIASPQHSPNVAAIQAAANSIKMSNDENEWCSAGKKRATSRPGKESSVSSTTTSNTSKDAYADLVAMMRENPQVLNAWTLAEPGNKRRAFALNVNSGTVARVIGRAGQNINAIREATNAHIEVEKIATRREQSARQITVKGTQDAIRNAVQMIDLLIRENETHVTDIILRILSTTSSNASPVNLPPASTVTLPSMIPIEKQLTRMGTAPPSTFAAFNAPSNAQSTAQTNAARLAQAAATGVNVWQQRAAIRKMKSEESGPEKKYPDQQQTSASQTSTGAYRPPSSTLSGSTSTSVSPAPASYPIQQPNPPVLATTTLAQHDYGFTVPVTTSDDLKRKAPGAERLGGTPIKVQQIMNPEEMSFTFSGNAPATTTNDKNAFVQPTSIGNAFLSSMLADSSTSTLSSFNDTSLSATPAPLSHLAVGSQRQNTVSSQPVPSKQQRPLSEIWDNASSTTSATSNQPLSGFGGLFSSIDPSKAAELWLPQNKNDSKEMPVANPLTTRDDHWLDSSASLFGSLALGDAFAAPPASNSTSVFATPTKPTNSVLGSSLSANRPHSSTDWTTNNAAAWSSGPTVQPPSSSAQRPYQQWAASPVNTNNVPAPPTTPQSYRSARPLLPSQMAKTGSPVSTAAASSNNWSNKMDVFNLIAAQVGDVAEQEKKKQAQQQQQSFQLPTNATTAPAASINKVYDVYYAPTQPLLLRNRTAQNPTPPTVPGFASNVTWSGQPNLLQNANPSMYAPNKPFGQPPQQQSQGIHPAQQQQPQQWNGGWNF